MRMFIQTAHNHIYLVEGRSMGFRAVILSASGNVTLGSFLVNWGSSSDLVLCGDNLPFPRDLNSFTKSLPIPPTNPISFPRSTHISPHALNVSIPSPRSALGFRQYRLWGDYELIQGIDLQGEPVRTGDPTGFTSGLIRVHPIPSSSRGTHPARHILQLLRWSVRTK